MYLISQDIVGVDVWLHEEGLCVAKSLARASGFSIARCATVFILALHVTLEASILTTRLTNARVILS